MTLREGQKIFLAFLIAAEKAQRLFIISGPIDIQIKARVIQVMTCNFPPGQKFLQSGCLRIFKVLEQVFWHDHRVPEMSELPGLANPLGLYDAEFNDSPQRF